MGSESIAVDEHYSRSSTAIAQGLPDGGQVMNAVVIFLDASVNDFILEMA